MVILVRPSAKQQAGAQMSAQARASPLFQSQGIVKSCFIGLPTGFDYG
jgi:hypothetical protein